MQTLKFLQRLSLRRRVAWGAALLGLTLSAAFAITAWFIAEDYEYLLLDSVMDAAVSAVRADIAAGRVPDLPQTAHLSAWLVDPASKTLPPGLSPAWLELPAGVHEGVVDAPASMHVQVYNLDERRLIYAMDIWPIEDLETYLIVASVLIVLIGGGISALLAQWLAGRALRPVHALADAVDGLSTRPQATALAADRPDDGLRRLALAIDSYQGRLLDSANKEREFLANASHELRSPVASLQGAVEVLLDDPGLAPRMRQRVDRIDRAAAELGQLLEALMLSARGAPEGVEALPLRELLDEVFGVLAERAIARTVSLQLTSVPQHLTITASRRWLRTLLLNLLRVLIDRNGVTQIQLTVIGAVIKVAFDGPLGELSHRSDQGLPLMLVERLCMQMGGQLHYGDSAIELHLH
jgi:signal transduction histidine kinase